MATDYRPMWKDLGLNLENHDKLMEVLGKAYGDIFISQKTAEKNGISRFCNVGSSRPSH